jgi:mycofactocin precursor
MPDQTKELVEPVASPASPGVDSVDAGGPSGDASDEHLLDDLLVEEVSIDGMCGVY